MNINSLFGGDEKPKKGNGKKVRNPFLPTLTNYKKGEQCNTINCSEFTTTEYANIVGLDRDKISEKVAGVKNGMII